MIFAVIAIVQAVRAFNGWPMQIDMWIIPVGCSWIGALIAAGMSVWAFRGTRE